MVRDIVWDLDLARHGVTASNRRVTRVDWCIVNATTSLAIRVSLERLAREPIVAVAWLISRAIRTVTTLLTIDVGAWKKTFFEAIFSSLLLSLGGDVVWIEELVDNILILTDTVCVHASMVAVVVNAPLYVNNLTRLVGGDGFFAPVGTGLIVVNADSSVVAARASSPDFGGVKVRPGGDGLQDGALGACIWAGLSLVSWSYKERMGLVTSALRPVRLMGLLR
jgi:hypothetical protein